ncbi:MAG TPA: hypothetical protein VNW90_16435 [Acetobacteraceae bacterium]|jgi:hypothetical protein|nr:hypothetical protein [Acetobacteraceae bacterium]
MSRPFVTLLPVLLAVAACEPPPPPTAQARADAATLAACREHADAVYDRTHRDSIYSINNSNTPYSANDAYSVVDHGLPQRYGYENMTRDCVRNTGSATDRPDTAAPGPTKP